MIDFTALTSRAYETGMDIYKKSEEIRKKAPINVVVKSTLLPNIFTLLEMGINEEEIKVALADCLEIAKIYKDSLKATE